MKKITKEEYYRLVNKLPSHNKYFLTSYPGRYRNTYVKNILKGLPKDAKILNVGDGTGSVSREFENMGFTNVIGVDVEEEFLKVARKQCKHSKFIKADAYKLPFKDDYFDVVTYVDVIEYLDADKAIKEGSRVLKSGGLMYVENFNSIVLKTLKNVFPRLIVARNTYKTNNNFLFKKILRKNKLKIIKYATLTEDLKNKNFIKKLFFGIILIPLFKDIFSPVTYFYLKKQKLDVDFVSVKLNDAIGTVQKEFERHLINHVNLNKIDVEDAGKNIFDRLFKLLIGSLKIIFHRNKLIHFSYSKNWYAHLNIIFKFKKSVLSVMHVDKAPLSFQHFGLNYRRLYNSFDHIIAISNKTKRDLINTFRVPKHKISVVYLGVDNLLFKPSTQKVFNFKYVVYVGNEIPRKNIPNILKAFKLIIKEFPDLRLVIIGNDKQNRQNTKKIIKHLGIDSQVIFPGFVTVKDLIKIYSNAEFLIFTTLFEGFGLPIVEAMACGCPVLTSNISPMVEIVGNTQMVANPKDFKDIAKNAIRILENDNLRIQMKRDGLKRAKQFGWNAGAKKIYKIYRKVLNA